MNLNKVQIVKATQDTDASKRLMRLEVEARKWNQVMWSRYTVNGQSKRQREWVRKGLPTNCVSKDDDAHLTVNAGVSAPLDVLRPVVPVKAHHEFP